MPKRTHGRPSSDYALEDATARGAWLASAGIADAPTIAARTGAALVDATRVALVRAYACPDVVAAWLEGRALTWRHLARIALVEAPGDPDGQLEAARAHASFVRWEASRARAPLAVVK